MQADHGDAPEKKTEKAESSSSWNILFCGVWYFYFADWLHKNPKSVFWLVLFSILGPCLGWCLKQVVSPKEKSVTAIQLGRRWFGWALFFVWGAPMWKIVVKDGALGLLIILAMETAIIGATAFGLGCGYYYILHRPKSPRQYGDRLDLETALRRLDGLRKDGILTEEEFSAEKKRLLS